MKVMIRIRPPLPREIETGVPFRSIAEVADSQTSISLVEYLGSESEELEIQHELITNPSLFQLHRFTFDFIFNMSSTQEQVYIKSAETAVISVLEGYNSTIFAYGQTGTGKTHTMEGFTFNSNDSERGIVPRCIEDIFTSIDSSSSNTKFIIKASYLQLYNENINDLLKPDKQNLIIREDKKKGIYVENLSEWIVRNPNDIYALLEQGTSFRETSSTLMNSVSSRSHAIFIINVEQMISSEENITITKVGKLNLVDLAGSERIRITGAKGKQLEESKRINKSLSALGNVINALTDSKGSHYIPYRDSKLTRLLADSLGGNCKTTMITTISPCHDHFSESLSSLLFAKRAKNIKNKPIVNQDLHQRALIGQYEIELKKLQNELQEKSRLLHSNEYVSEIEEMKSKYEKDKKEILKQLEKMSKQYMHEKEEKNKLKKILMNAQMVKNSSKIEDMPQFRVVIEEKEKLLLKELDVKFKEIEKEKQQLEEDKIEIEKYKELLLKQRDIMISLTTKINERDETITQLQDEIEKYETMNKNNKELNSIYKNSIQTLIQLCQVNSITIPECVTLLQQKENELLMSGDNILNVSNQQKKINEYESNNEQLIKNNDNNNLSTSLNPHEQIKELTNIIKQQKNEIYILKLVSQKLITTSCDNDNAQIDINSIMKSLCNGIELHNQIRELEQDNMTISQDFQKQNEIITSLTNENKVFTEQNSNLEKLIERNNKEISTYNEIITNANKMISDIIITYINIDNNLKNDLNSLYNVLSSHNNKTFKHSNSFKVQSVNSSLNSSLDNVNRSVGGFGESNNSYLKYNCLPEKGMFSYISKPKFMHRSCSSNYTNNVDKESSGSKNYMKMNGSKHHSDKFINRFINTGK